MSVAPREGRDVDEEVRRLAALFRLAQDHARVTGTTLVWEADLSGYRFHQRDATGGDSPLPEDELLRARRWPFAATRVVADPIVFGREPLLEPATIALSTASREIRLRLDPLGNLTEVR